MVTDRAEKTLPEDKLSHKKFHNKTELKTLPQFLYLFLFNWYFTHKCSRGLLLVKCQVLF